jgi:hypothetical protein
MNEEDRESEEVDVEPFEGEPDFEDSPTQQHAGNDELVHQDDESVEEVPDA